MGLSKPSIPHLLFCVPWVCPAIKNAQGKYYLNGHWTIDFSRALHIASTVVHYDRGSEGDLAPELLYARGPTTEPLVIEVSSCVYPWLMLPCHWCCRWSFAETTCLVSEV